MTYKEAVAYCIERYNEQCDRYPRTREIRLSLYLRRNVQGILKWRNSAEYAAISDNK